MKIAPFKPQDLLQMRLQNAQAQIGGNLTLAYAQNLARRGPAYTGRTDRIVCCAGLYYADGASRLWSFIAEGAPMLSVHRAALRLIAYHPRERLTATVRTGFAEGCRWLELLGFEKHGSLQGYDFDGTDHHLYVRA